MAFSIALLGGLLPFPSGPLAPTETRAATVLPTGFVDEILATGMFEPAAISFAPDGRVFVAERAGIIKTWPNYASLISNAAPTQSLDIRTAVHGYWDRGLLGMAISPNYPSDPSMYIVYAYDAAIGGTAPTWGTANNSSDGCPTPPSPTTDGCVVSGRLDHLTLNTSTGVVTGRTQMLNDWCMQFPSHSTGSVAFGADGMLYVSGGEGASFNSYDWGQFGGTLPAGGPFVIPQNPCGDPFNANPSTGYLTSEGGQLRSQDIRTTGDPTGLSGTVIRIDPSTGAPATGNPLIGNSAYSTNAKRIVGFGFRNPFRFTVRPGTSDLWIGDVGGSTWEEVNRLADATAGSFPLNYGWPCFEGNEQGTIYPPDQTPNLCTSLSAGAVTGPQYTYNHAAHMVTGDSCTTGSSSISGIAFENGSNFPSTYHGALFFADYSRDCISVMLAGGNGLPDPTQVKKFASGASNPVQLVSDPNGDLLYPDFLNGTIHRIRYNAPLASFTATPSTGIAPLTVQLNASASSSTAGIASYSWDFDGNGTWDLTTGSATTSHVYGAGSYTVHLKVTDNNSVTAETTRTVSAGNSPPVITIDTPVVGTKWKVGDTINFSAHATDAQDGTLASSAFSWQLLLHHCPSDCHIHAVQNGTGNSGSFVAPDHEYPSYLELVMTATDSANDSASVSLQLDPKTVDLTLASNPSTLYLTLNSVTAPTPMTKTVIVGSSNGIAAPSAPGYGGVTKLFTGWSDGGAITHTITAPATNKTYTATYSTLTLTARTSPSGLPITIKRATGSATGNAPNALDVLKNEAITVIAPLRAQIGSTDYVFDHWSDGGAATHTFGAPGANTTYTAVYRVRNVGVGVLGGLKAPASFVAAAESVVAPAASAGLPGRGGATGAAASGTEPPPVAQSGPSPWSAAWLPPVQKAAMIVVESIVAPWMLPMSASTTPAPEAASAAPPPVPFVCRLHVS